jgi:hypothetical protein
MASLIEGGACELVFVGGRVFFLGVSKKIDKLIKLKKPEKNNRKKNQINRLKNHKKVPVRFGFDFQSLKPIEPNRTGSTMPALKKMQI